MAYQPIENYGIIGNMRTAALIAVDGSIDWFCFPHFDSPSVFAAILDDNKGGRFQITSTHEGILRPLAVLAAGEDLSGDKSDKDIGRVAAFCAEPQRKPTELGAFAHFLQTVIHSQQRRQTSRLIGCFLRLVAEWTGSTWLLDPDGLHRELTLLTTSYRNRSPPFRRVIFPARWRRKM